MRLRGKVALVTGATSGIGLEIARGLAREGARVAGAGRDPGRLRALSSEVELAIAMDVTDDAAVTEGVAAVERALGPVDLLVNNAGIGLFATWEATDVDAIARVMDVNLYGAVRVARRVLPGMIARGDGVIANIASVAGKRGYPKHTAYAATKHALIGWSEGLRCDVAAAGVDVVVICPPAVRTPFFENAGYFTFDADHPGFVPMTAEEAGRLSVEAIARRDRQAILGARAKALYALSLVAPGLLDRARKKR